MSTGYTAASSSSARQAWSLRERLARASAVLAALAALSLLLAGLSLAAMVRTQRHVTDVLLDATVHSAVAYRSVIEQQTGLRGYELAREPDFLQPYTDGLAREREAYLRLDAILADEPALRANLDAARAAAQRWREEIAEPRIAAIRAGRTTPFATDELRVGRERFDEARTSFEAYRNSLLDRREADERQLRRDTRWLVAAFAFATVVSVLAGLALWRALRRWVTDPLTRLGSEVSQVRSGHLDRPVAVEGPEEIAGLAAHVEAMRRRVVAEYSAAQRARAQAEAARADAETAQRTVEEQAVELRRSNGELEQFAYVASHDLQEPLRKVASFCQMLERRYKGQLDERADQYIAFAVDGSKRMQALINDLLTFSRVGRVTSGFTDVHLDECVARARHVLEDAIAESGAVVTCDELPVVRGEVSLLTQLFQNLLGNALKFAGPTPPRIHVGARLVAGGLDADGRSPGSADRSGPEPEWELCCSDNGIGIEPQYAEKIFVIFQRLHGREEYAGTGIGLALCRKIVEYHGGRIWLDVEASGPGGGTTFRWTLPVLHRENPGASAAAGDSDAPQFRAEEGSVVPG